MSKLCSKLGDEEAEYILVCVDLSECAIQLARRAYGHLHCNTWVDFAIILGVDLATHSPFSLHEICIVDPGLVKIDHSRSRQELINHELCIVLAEY